MKRRGRMLVVAAGLAAIILAWAFLGREQGTRTDYRTFARALEEGRVSGVTFGDSRLVYTLQGDGTAYVTDDPESPDLRERLLLEGVAVRDGEEAGKAVDQVFDVLADLLFLAIIVFGVRRWFGFHAVFKVARHTGVRFDDICGMAEEKADLQKLVDLLKHPRPGVRPIKGVLLEGPPGNGKTLLAKAVAEESGVCFIATKGADFQSTFMAVGPARVRMLFRKARRHKPCIIFIDEFDGIGERRNYEGRGIDKENNRMLVTLLNEMDGFTPLDGVLVIAATNSYASLDPALVRPGRFDLKYHVGNPDEETRRQLVARYTKGRPLAMDGEVLVRAFDGMSCAAVETVLNEAWLIAGDRAHPAITPDDIKDAVRKVR